MNLSTELPFVRLKIERKSTHPWIFQKMVEKPEQKPRPGSVVDIVDATNHWVGRGFYNGHSRIALRVLTEDYEEAVDAAFFQRKIAEAVANSLGQPKFLFTSAGLLNRSPGTKSRPSVQSWAAPCPPRPSGSTPAGLVRLPRTPSAEAQRHSARMHGMDVTPDSGFTR